MKRRFWIFSLALVPMVRAAELTPETLSAWERYIQSADAAMRARAEPGHPFLWMDEASDRRQRVRAGEILVTGVGDRNPKKAGSGLIHHWMGAVFFPHARLEDVLGVLRDYAHYKDYYNPTVVDSKTIAETPSADRFSMLLVNQSFFQTKALESEYTSSYTSVGSHRGYSFATTLRLCEVEDYGQSSERELPPDEGSGYVWRLHTITRYEEADGGVYVEMEAMALSRDIPGALRWLVDPIVRRLSKGAMVTSLRQTLDAVSGKTQTAKTPAPPMATPSFGLGILPLSSHPNF